MPPRSSPPTQLLVRPRRLIRVAVDVCIVAGLAFWILDLLLVRGSWGVIEPLRHLFDLEHETGLPRWFFVSQMLMISLTSWLIYAVGRSRRSKIVVWFVLAVFFSLLTVTLGARLLSRLTDVDLAVAHLLAMAGGTVLWFLLLRHAAGLGSDYRVTVDDERHAGPDPATEDPSGLVRIRLSSGRIIRRVVVTAVLLELGLVLLDYHVTLRGLEAPGFLRSLFNMAREDSLPNWIGATQTTLAAGTLWLVLFVVRARTSRRWLRWGWLALAVFFTYMAVDDGASLHENFGLLLEQLAGRFDESGGRLLRLFPSYPWHLLFVPLFAAAGLFAAVFLVRQSSRAKARVLVLASLALLGLAVGLDFLEGLDRQHPWNPHSRLVAAFDLEESSERLFRKSPHFIVRHVAKTFEEFLEMLANTLLWSVFLGHLLEVGSDLRIRVGDPRH